MDISFTVCYCFNIISNHRKIFIILLFVLIVQLKYNDKFILHIVILFTSDMALIVHNLN